jgi:hypothetical protein
MLIINVQYMRLLKTQKLKIKNVCSKQKTVCDRTPRIDVRIVVGDFIAKIRKEDIFIPEAGQYSFPCDAGRGSYLWAAYNL